MERYQFYLTLLVVLNVATFTLVTVCLTVTLFVGAKSWQAAMAAQELLGVSRDYLELAKGHAQLAAASAERVPRQVREAVQSVVEHGSPNANTGGK